MEIANSTKLQSCTRNWRNHTKAGTRISGYPCEVRLNETQRADLSSTSSSAGKPPATCQTLKTFIENNTNISLTDHMSLALNKKMKKLKEVQLADEIAEVAAVMVV